MTLTLPDGTATDAETELHLAGVPAAGATRAELQAAHVLPANPTGEELRAAPSLAAAVRDLDSRRKRSRQRKIGASEIGECRRRAAYRITGTKPTNVTTGLQAALGTILHKDLLKALQKMYGGLVEVKLEGEQIKGSCDWWTGDGIEDLKTTSQGGFEKVLSRGAYAKHWFQVVTYGWLARTGQTRDRRLPRETPLDVEQLRIRYLSRDSGEDLVFAREYDPMLAAEAIFWLADVYAALEDNGRRPEEIHRDGYGPNVDVMCEWCPFLDACWGPPLPVESELSRQSQLTVTDEDYVAAVRDYDQWRKAEAEAKRNKEYARERLRGREGPAGDLHCAWTGGNERPQVDKDAAVDRLAELGHKVPTRMVRSPRAIRVTVNVSKDAQGG
jgi:hypothetical protein